tara:strand:- start:1878 stop:2765 length:888 start_codon:yes stop_codon:yes gene_type:complete
MNTKLEYFKNKFTKYSENIYILNKEDSYVENFGKQWRDYRNVQIDSLNDFNISERYLKNIFFNNLNLINNKSVLEIGGGAGRFTEHIVKRAKSCVSVDLSSSVFYNIARNNKKLIILKADFNELVSNKKFDIVFCRGVLQHTVNPLEYLLKIHTFVKKDGCVVFDIYKMPKIGYLHPKYFFWRPIIKFFIKYEKFEFFLKKNIKWLLKIKRIVKKIFFKSDFIADSIIPIWDYKDKINISDKKLEYWSIMDTLDGIYAKYDFPQRSSKIIKKLKKNNIHILNFEADKNFFMTKIL